MSASGSVLAKEVGAEANPNDLVGAAAGGTVRCVATAIFAIPTAANGFSSRCGTFLHR